MGHHRGRLTETPPPDGDGEFMSLLFSNSDCNDGATGGGGRTEKIKSSMKEVDLLCMYNGGQVLRGTSRFYAVTKMSKGNLRLL